MSAGSDPTALGGGISVSHARAFFEAHRHVDAPNGSYLYSDAYGTVTCPAHRRSVTDLYEHCYKDCQNENFSNAFADERA